MSGPRLSIIPARAATDRNLKPRDLQVLCVLGRHTDDLGWCRKSQVKMADEMGCARSTVFEAVERLVKAGYLERHVQEEQSGRDSPHVYRVILDPVHPSVEAVKEAEDPCRQAGTPAGISAPPAGPEPAPPAGPGPAPKNDPLRTTDSERIERERGREEISKPENEDGDLEDPRRIEARGWALLKDWPGFAGMPKDAAMRAWKALSAEERAEAERKFKPWLALLKAQRKTHVPAPSTYFGQKLFAEVAVPLDAPKPTTLSAAPFGPLWQAVRLKQLVSGPTAALPALTATERGWIADGTFSEEKLLRSKRERSGYPGVNRMHDLAGQGRGISVAAAVEALAGDMEPVPVASPRFEAWRAEHERRGWPWLPDTGRLPVVYFPRGGPDALAGFEARVMRDNGDKADEHGGQSQAAE